jgi:hypothetical protein
MNHDPDNERLLNDVLSDAAPAEFRDSILGETLRAVRRRRRWRQTRRAVALFAALGLLWVLVWQNLPPRPAGLSSTVAKAGKKGYTLIQTHPLPAGAIVATRPLPAGRLLASVATVKLVQTAAGDFHVLNDDALLALIGPRPAALVRVGPHSEKLVFVNPADENGFPVN